MCDATAACKQGLSPPGRQSRAGSRGRGARQIGCGGTEGPSPTAETAAAAAAANVSVRRMLAGLLCSNSMQMIGAHTHLHLEAQGCKQPAFELRSSRSEIAVATATITTPETTTASAADAVIAVLLWDLRGRCSAGLLTTADPRLQRSGPSSFVSCNHNEVVAIKDCLSPRMCAAPRRSLRAHRISEWRPVKTNHEEEAALQCTTTARRLTL
jgi:hypothetical protein